MEKSIFFLSKLQWRVCTLLSLGSRGYCSFVIIVLISQATIPFSSVSKEICVDDFAPSISAHAYNRTFILRSFALQTIESTGIDFLMSRVTRDWRTLNEPIELDPPLTIFRAMRCNYTTISPCRESLWLLEWTNKGTNKRTKLVLTNVTKLIERSYCISTTRHYSTSSMTIVDCHCRCNCIHRIHRCYVNT